MSADISVFSRRNHQKNFRTAAHNKLLKDDDTFDLRMHAVSHVINDINDIYAKSVSIVHTDLAEKVLKYRLWSNSNDSVPILTISSGLSEADREQTLHYIVDIFAVHSMCRYASICCASLTHTDDIFEAIFTSLQWNLRQQNNIKRSGRREPTVVGSTIERIQSLLDMSSHTPDRLYVIVQDAELLSAQLLSDFVACCDSTFPVVIVLIHNSALPLPFPLNANMNARIACDMLATSTPARLMDVCSGLLVLDEYLSLVLPSSLLCRLYTFFDTYERCVYTFVQRLHLYISEHFVRRSALLSMYRHIPFILDRKITATKGALPAIYSRAVAQLMWYMDATDLSPCASFLNMRDSRTAQADTLLQQLYVTGTAHKLRLIAFDWLKTIRNKFLAPQERNTYPILLLWEVCSHDYLSCSGDYEAALKPIFGSLLAALRGMTLHHLNQLISSWSCFVSPSFDIDIGKDVIHVLDGLKAKYEALKFQLVAVLDIIQCYKVNPQVSSFNTLRNTDMASPTSTPFEVMKLDDFNVLGLIEQYLEALHEFIVHSIHILLSQPTPHLIPSITTLTSEALERVSDHLFVDIRRRVTTSLTHDSHADDISLLYSLLQSRDKTDILTHEIVEEFLSSCAQWAGTSEKKGKTKRKRSESEIDEEVVHGRCRFLMALNELQKMGYVKVTSTGNYIKKLIASAN